MPDQLKEANRNRRRQLCIEVVYAEPGKQVLRKQRVREGTTAGEALQQAGLQEEFPATEFANAEIGIWGRRAAHSRLLRDGDRLEVYRPLKLDPREARRQLAAHGLAMGQRDAAAD
ncbi:MAG: RnfH family protein [Woeseia sp.]